MEARRGPHHPASARSKVEDFRPFSATGGLSSHALFLLVRAYVVATEETPRGAPVDLGQALMGLLDWYANFDFSSTQVRWSDRPFAQRPPLGAARGYPPPPLGIEGIGEGARNIGAKAFATGAVVSAFNRARVALGAVLRPAPPQQRLVRRVGRATVARCSSANRGCSPQRWP